VANRDQCEPEPARRRYSGARRIDEMEFRDAAWPAHYEIGATKSVSRRTIAAIQDALDVAAPY
jgi:hypothetical protein